MENVASSAPNLWRALPLDKVILTFFCLGIPLLLSFSSDLFNDGDTSWHLAAGRLIAESLTVPDVDPFSFTFFGKPWVAHEWLAEVMMASAYAAAGWSGLAALTASAIGILLLLIGNEARRHMPPIYLACLLTAVLLILGPFILARPHVIAWPLLAGWTLLLLAARDAERAPPLAASLLMLLWANLHGSFLFGLLLIGPFVLEALIQSKNKAETLRDWALFGALSLILSFLTPHGVHGLLFPLQVSSMEALSLIEEWRPTTLTEMKGFALVLFGALFFALHKGLKVSLIRLLLLIALLFLAFQHVRHQAVLAIVGGLLLIEPIGRTAGSEPDRSGFKLGFAPGLAALVVACMIIRLAIPMDQPQSPTNPARAIAGLKPELRERPVLNSYSFGGPLILNGIKPYVDGRADMYGDDFMMEYKKITSGDRIAFERAVSRWNIGWTILVPGEKLVSVLDDSRNWRRIHSDQWAVIHIRDAP